MNDRFIIDGIMIRQITDTKVLAEIGVQLIERVKELEDALQPFAQAADEVPDGLRSVLRIPEVGNFNKTIYLSATTDHLLAAKNAL